MFSKPADMFDRDEEWTALTRFVADDRPGARLGVVSGRRRQGKTFLLDALCGASGGFFFEADAGHRRRSRCGGIGEFDRIDLHWRRRFRSRPADWHEVLDAPALGSAIDQPVTCGDRRVPLLWSWGESVAALGDPGHRSGRAAPERDALPYPAAAVRVRDVVHGRAAGPVPPRCAGLRVWRWWPRLLDFQRRPPGSGRSSDPAAGGPVVLGRGRHPRLPGRRGGRAGTEVGRGSARGWPTTCSAGRARCSGRRGTCWRKSPIYVTVPLPRGARGGRGGNATRGGIAGYLERKATESPIAVRPRGRGLLTRESGRLPTGPEDLPDLRTARRVLSRDHAAGMEPPGKTRAGRAGLAG